MGVLLGVIVLFTVLCLIVAVMQAMAVVRAAPASANLAGFMPLGWWKFRQLDAKAGAAAAQPLAIYKRAVVAFVVFAVLGLLVSGWLANQTPAVTSAAAAAAPISHARFTPVEFALNAAPRRVATMPGAPQILES